MCEKNIFFVSLLTIFVTININAQELSIDLSIFGYQKEPRETPYLANLIRANVILGLSYSDTLSTKFDYKVGLGYSYFEEDYYSHIRLTGDTILGEVFTYRGRIGDRYRTYNTALDIGVIYWPWQKRSGLFIPFGLLSIITIDSKLEQYRYDVNNNRQFFYSDVEDDLNKLNFIFRTGVGYKLIAYRGFSVSAVFNVTLRFGDVVKGVDDSFAVGRGLNLIGGIKF